MKIKELIKKWFGSDTDDSQHSIFDIIGDSEKEYIDPNAGDIDLSGFVPDEVFDGVID